MSCLLVQAQQQGVAPPPAPAPPEEDKEEDKPSFKAFGGKAYSLKG